MVWTRAKMEQRIEAVERSQVAMKEKLLRLEAKMETMMERLTGMMDAKSERGRSRSHPHHHSLSSTTSARLSLPTAQTASRVAAPNSQSRTSSKSPVVSHSSSQKSSQSASSFILSQVSSELLTASHSSSMLAASHTSRVSPLSLGSVKWRQPSSNDRSTSQFEEKAEKFTEGEDELEEPVSVIAGPEAGAIAGPETFSKYEFVKPDLETNSSTMLYHHSSNINWEGLNKFDSLSYDQAVGMGQAFYLCSGYMKPPKFAVQDGTLAYIDPGMRMEGNKINHCEEIVAARRIGTFQSSAISFALIPLAGKFKDDRRTPQVVPENVTKTGILIIDRKGNENVSLLFPNSQIYSNGKASDEESYELVVVSLRFKDSEMFKGIFMGMAMLLGENLVLMELPRKPTHMLQAEDRGYRQGQKVAVHLYIFCAKDAVDQVSWLNLSERLRRVSFAIKEKYDVVQKMKVEIIPCLGGNAEIEEKEMSVQMVSKRVDGEPGEVQFQIDTEVQSQIDTSTPYPVDIGGYQMVEELWMVADMAVSEKRLNKYPTYSLLRCHPSSTKEMHDYVLPTAVIVVMIGEKHAVEAANLLYSGRYKCAVHHETMEEGYKMQLLGEFWCTGIEPGGIVLRSILPSWVADMRTETNSPEAGFVSHIGKSIRDHTWGSEGDNNLGQKEPYVDKESEWTPKRRRLSELKYWEGRSARMKCKWKIMADSYHPP